MASFNRVILVGNVTRDIELRYYWQRVPPSRNSDWLSTTGTGTKGDAGLT